MIEQRVTLRYGAQQIPAIVQAVQGDTGRDVIFELADYEIPAGATANYYIDKPDGNAVYNSAEVLSSTEILAHLTEQTLAVPGRNNGQVRILSDGEVITSFDFVLEVEVFRGLMRIQSETEVNIFDEALQAAAEDAIQEILDQTPVVTGMQNSIAPTYSSSSTYAVGDYVMYNAQLYRCVTAITTAEAWTATHWTQVPLANDVNDLKSALDITSVDNSNFTVGKTGKYVNTEGGISSYNAYNISTPIAVSKGDAISVHYTANSSVAVVSYCDENGGIDSVVETGKGQDKDYSFISSVDGYICVSYDNARPAYYSLTHYGFVSDTNTHLSELDSSVLKLENSVSNIDADQLIFIDNTISNNLFNPAALTVGSILGNDGVPIDLSYCSHTDYIGVAPNDVVRCTPYYLNNETSVTLYNSSKEYVQHTRWIQTVSDGVLSFTVPSGVAYMVLNVYNKHIPNIVVVKNMDYDADLAGYYGQSIKLKGCKYESALFGKKIAYNGDSICNSRITSDSGSNGGAYAYKIALATGSSYENRAEPGGILASAAPGGQTSNRYVVSDVTNMANDADLVCFEGGINDYWKNVPLGDYSESDYSSTLDTTTICGALESIFRQATAKWIGKPIVFVITHKIKSTVYVQNTAGYTWTDVHEKMVGICKKYAIPYYDAFENSGLNAYNDVQNTNFLTSNESGVPDGCHPNSAGYDKYYVPQLIALFESVMPKS